MDVRQRDIGGRSVENLHEKAKTTHQDSLSYFKQLLTDGKNAMPEKLRTALHDDMNTHIALLHGIGGKNTLPMSGLVELLQDMGLERVRTYIQTGNAIFQSSETHRRKLSDRIKAAIDDRYGFAPETIILTPDQMEEAIASNPYPEAEPEPKTLHLTFLAVLPKAPAIARLDSLKKDSERFTLKGQVFYLHAPEGVGRSKLFAQIEKSLGVTGTARNWRSVCKIRDLSGAG